MKQKRTKQSYAELEVNEAYVYLNSPPASEVAEVKPVMKSSALNGENVRVSILRAILSRDDQTKKPTNEQKKLLYVKKMMHQKVDRRKRRKK